MVKNPGTPLRPHGLRPLAGPAPLDVRAGARGEPVAVRFEGALRDVEAIQDRWRIDDEWWRERELSRMYYEVRLDGGRIVTVYRDLLAETWWLQRY